MKCEFKGGNFPVAICNLDAGEAINCESGAMAWMSEGIRMETNTGGGLGKMFGRAFSGESLFMNRYVAEKPGILSIGAHAPGEIRKITITPEKSIVVQKGSFLAKDESVDLSIFFQKKLGSGFFGGEGFIMNRLSGNGDVLIEIDGGVVEYDLAPGEKMTIDTGYLVMMDDTCSIDIVMIKGMTNILFGGEGLFNTVVTGPGRIMIQTQPMVQFVSTIAQMMAAKGQK
ncbi:TIGR00266 family protein [Pseudobutyrivibrio sp. YE44]|uniref:TIGR00266 family protein n=1 Tax=Pseudobutyrivibrio sp. YE44 TaxID=1520802 RepID=UPI0008877976|nr:TIGR00266 family protein [Pseudobutyrivibrio sp. YE44]SDB24962.1 TIGR00266 family protein [Pseudobutyrivibrio sp. YE44]